MSEFESFLMRFLPSRGPIPPEFHTECGDGPFETCGACHRSLVERTGYSLIKEYQGERCIFEFALCHECGAQLGECISPASEARLVTLVPARATDPGLAPEDCYFCGASAGSLTRYSTRIRCRGHDWIDGPENFCQSCEERIQELLSAETRGEFEDWFREHVPGMPTADIDIETLISKL